MRDPIRTPHAQPLRERRVARFARPAIQIIGFLRKEIGEVLHQPRLILVLVAGPFIVLFLFAAGYDTNQAVLRTVFVGPSDSIYERSLDQYADDLRFYVTNEGFTPDLVAAKARLDNGEVDLVVVFPANPVETVMGGEQATIIVLHDKLDPIQQVAVEIASQVAVQELNATVLAGFVDAAYGEVDTFENRVVPIEDVLNAASVAASAGRSDEARRLLADLPSQLDTLLPAFDTSQTVLDQMAEGGVVTPQTRDRLESSRAAVDELRRTTEQLSDTTREVSASDIDAASAALSKVRANSADLATIEPAVLTRPFAADTENLLRERVGVNDFFAPAAIALLLQHMVLTFAAMSLVKDRMSGLFEVYRVGPIGPARILLGKFLSYVAIGGAVAAVLLSAVVFGLDVPLRGSVGAIALGAAGLLAASISLGLLLSTLAATDSQAVQYAMLTLLAGLFFGGFLLELNALTYPVKALSWMLPVTYGVRLFRDVMLRGDATSLADLGGLAAGTVGYGMAAWYLMARRLRIR